ncbi:hypothetical protein NBO_6g0003 [Nosema bombycis CQ1]|uniref:Uncharacterized protein n=1 Tax=Nosema bombycis (strain CQ1 / CVCC 102059) TaxID=578461 RepID=R0MLX7_NOSB1|nr:hypothetical protein NBO_6g0003 [Nosema bombycis CQ1]|eukprot:EOB15250.1 hypothetical protein NBO_6g0003 [Nosema bombycis CQ1]
MIVFEVLFYMIYNIICSDNKIKIKDERITIVFDRHIYDYKLTNFSNQTEINLSIDFVRRREKNLFVCDSFFPNLFFIDLNIGELKKFSEKLSFVFACFTEKNNVLFDFKIDYNLSNIMLSEFHGFGEEKLNLERYKTKKYDVFILSSKVKNLNAIKNSLDYSEKKNQSNHFSQKC